jgi:glycosyltransferase involved in cell wall biosynthesis
MRILFIADGRSPTALNWISWFVTQGHEAHLASTFPCTPPFSLASQHLTPVAFSARLPAARIASKQDNQESPSSEDEPRQVSRLESWLWGTRLIGFRTWLRHWIGPAVITRGAPTLAQVINDVQPEIVHAMRIPYEGMLAAAAFFIIQKQRPAPNLPPLLVSVWGNDFTLHARANPWMAAWTRRTMQIANALHADCRRDQELAINWGFSREKPAVVLPGSGGIQAELFRPPDQVDKCYAFTIINPRGVRLYVRNDTFFKAIPLVQKNYPHARFVCPAMQGEPEMEGWVRSLGITQAVQLLPKLSREDMPGLYQQACIAVSPSIHDGTPNTLLESMACGCFPIAGDIESLREWITNGKNGLLVDPGNPSALAEAICQALSDADLRNRAFKNNQRLIAERANYPQVMRQALAFYEKII